MVESEFNYMQLSHLVRFENCFHERPDIIDQEKQLTTAYGVTVGFSSHNGCASECGVAWVMTLVVVRLLVELASGLLPRGI